MWVIFVLVTGASSAGSSGGGGTGNSDIDGALALIALGIGLVFGCVAFVIGGPIRGGYDLAMVRHSRGDTSLEFGDMFAGFSKLLNLFLANLLYSLACLVGFCMCIIPGLIAALTLWPMFLLVMEDDLSPVDAIKAAWGLTSPHIGPLFVVALACFAINVVGFLACCIGLLVTGPVTQLVFATAYREIRGS